MGKKSRTDTAQAAREHLAGRMASRAAESRHIEQTKLLAEIARQSKSTAKELRAVGKAIAEIAALLAPMTELLNAPSGAETARHARVTMPTVPEGLPYPRIMTVSKTVRVSNAHQDLATRGLVIKEESVVGDEDGVTVDVVMPASMLSDADVDGLSLYVGGFTGAGNDGLVGTVHEERITEASVRGDLGWVNSPIRRAEAAAASRPGTVLGVMVHHEDNWALDTADELEAQGYTVVADAAEVAAHIESVRCNVDAAYRTMPPHEAEALCDDLSQLWVREVLKKRRERLRKNLYADMTDAPPRTTDIPQGVTIEMLRNNPGFAERLANSRGVNLADWLATDGKPSSEQIAGDQG